MADIAMLVAEEYERRIKIASRKTADDDAASVAVVVSAGSVANLAVQKLREMNLAMVNKTEDAFKSIEPRSRLGLAAFSGFFSAWFWFDNRVN